MLNDFYSIFFHESSIDQFFWFIMIFIFSVVTFTFVYRCVQFYIDYKNNKLIMDDIESGINLDKLINEAIMLKGKSVLASILYDGFEYYKKQKEESGDFVYLMMNNKMMQRYNREKEFLLRNFYLYEAAFIFSILIGFIYFFKAIIINDINAENVFYVLIPSLKYILLSLFFGSFYLCYYYFAKNYVHNTMLKIKYNIYSYLVFFQENKNL